MNKLQTKFFTNVKKKPPQQELGPADHPGGRSGRAGGSLPQEGLVGRGGTVSAGDRRRPLGGPTAEAFHGREVERGQGVHGGNDRGRAGLGRRRIQVLSHEVELV